jgi:hypothetical protein
MWRLSKQRREAHDARPSATFGLVLCVRQDAHDSGTSPINAADAVRPVGGSPVPHELHFDAVAGPPARRREGQNGVSLATRRGSLSPELAHLGEHMAQTELIAHGKRHGLAMTDYLLERIRERRLMPAVVVDVIGATVNKHANEMLAEGIPREDVATWVQTVRHVLQERFAGPPPNHSTRFC